MDKAGGLFWTEILNGKKFQKGLLRCAYSKTYKLCHS